MLILPIDDNREWIQWWIEDEEYEIYINQWLRENGLLACEGLERMFAYFCVSFNSGVYYRSLINSKDDDVTDIQRLWESAKTNEDAKEIQELLSAEAVAICISCGAETTLDKTSGCYTCNGCGQKVCGDG